MRCQCGFDFVANRAGLTDDERRLQARMRAVANGELWTGLLISLGGLFIKWLLIPGVVLTARGLRARRRLAKPEPAPPRDERPQLVGRACTACRGPINFKADATWCEVCGEPVHLACLARHPHERSAPYR